MSQYHELADKTMDHLLESLEELVDEAETPGYEVEYHVRTLSADLNQGSWFFSAEWSPHTQPRSSWNLRRKQTASE